MALTQLDASALERRMRAFKRTIVGLSSVDVLNLDDTQLATFEARLTISQQEWKEFQRLWEAREDLAAKTSGDTFPTEAWEQLYSALREEIVVANGLLLAAQKRESRRSQNDANANASLLNVSSVQMKPQLPRIQIPTFSGNIINWTHFKDTFSSLIHNEPSLTNIERFHYLVGSLSGEAAALISKFPVEEGTYLQAWNKVVQTYDNPRLLATLLINKIVDCDTRHAKSEAQRYEEFLTGVADSIDAFRALKLPNATEFILGTLALRSMDADTRRQFEMSLKGTNSYNITADMVIDFVRQRSTALKMSQQAFPEHSSSRGCTSRAIPKAAHTSSRLRSFALQTENSTGHNKSKCPHCKGKHLLFQCDNFKDLPVEQRSSAARRYKVCFNCLRPDHLLPKCQSRFRCQKCKEKHHTLLHRDTKAPNNSNSINDCKPPSNVALSGFTDSETRTESMVCLGTVGALIRGSRGQYHAVRALLDSGSQHSFVTTELANRIGDPINAFKGAITGLADSSIPRSQLRGTISCVLRPYAGAKDLKFHPIVIDSITSAMPSCALPSSTVDELSTKPLADHQFGKPGPIDLLIGGDLYMHVITGTPYPSGVQQLFLLPTIFGLVVSGVATVSSSSPSHSFLSLANKSLESQLKRFWEIEEPRPADCTDPDDLACEEHFVNTHSRLPDGRYVVRLPFKSPPQALGDNKREASRRYFSLEIKFKKQPSFAVSYKAFMKEYRELGHLSSAPEPASYLVPHHGIWQERPEGPKLRVVFDASSPSATRSLNHHLHAGAKLQEDLCSILLRFRLHPIAICADIVKMYRQILIHREDRRYQHILWRDEPSDPLEELRLNTVTYGVRSSAFQALRVIKQLVKDEGSMFPLAAPRILHDMYVDDVVTGAETLDEAEVLIKELGGLFAKGGFALSKWASNISFLTPGNEDIVQAFSHQHPEDTCLKILGLSWNSSTDTLFYSVRRPPASPITKRTILSVVARIFDPLGLLSPVVLVAKALIQEIWKAKLDWDDPIPEQLNDSWTALASTWHLLAAIAIPRLVAPRQSHLQLVGFSDASSKAYAAALYLRAETTEGHVTVSLIQARSKVSPLKYHSIPRLELCGALLLARLVSSLHLSTAQPVVCFTDSTTVLSWLNTQNHKLGVFEANRVSQVQELVPCHRWRYVKSEENPADIGSRGCNPDYLQHDSLWWHGPKWICDPVPSWFTPIPEGTSFSAVCHSDSRPVRHDLTECFSGYANLIRTVIRIKRLALRAKSYRSSIDTPTQRIAISAPISAPEFLEAELTCSYYVQRQYLPDCMFKRPPEVPKEYQQLSPFLDERGIFRVGGRLQHSPLKFTSRHPILLPRKTHFSQLVVDYFHEQHFHAGPSLTLSLLRSKFWIPGATVLVKSRIRRCVPCRILNAKPNPQLMAPLPRERFEESRAFLQVGVDYAGPFFIKESRRRNAALGKAYLCLFVCFSTKALHLELVSSLSTSAFFSALDRFISRRGMPNTIWSDHGTNFVGASRFLKELWRFLRSSQDEVHTKLAVRGIEWRFIPPRAPHFGGLWEAGIKSVKALLPQVFGKTPATFEELSTVLHRIEALLNSRPLCPLRDSVEDFDFLTPGHFLIGSSLVSLPDPSQVPTVTRSFIHQWKSTQERINHLWRRWRRDYLHTLMQRRKWFHPTRSLRKGELVILLERRSPAGHWPVARVESLLPGRDGIVRTVLVRTPSGGTLTRAVTSLAPLFHLEGPESRASSPPDSVTP